METSAHMRLFAPMTVLCSLLCATPAAQGCGELLKGEMVASQRDIGAVSSGESRTHLVLGAGWLRAVELVKRGGLSDDTAVTLELDGEPMLSTTFAVLKNPWMQLETPLMGAKVRAEDDASVLTIWYSQELRFTTMATIRVDVREEGVTDLRLRTVMNKPAPHEHIAGQAIGTTAAALPAFR
jgi:hypothetical protein